MLFIRSPEDNQRYIIDFFEVPPKVIEGRLSGYSAVTIEEAWKKHVRVVQEEKNIIMSHFKQIELNACVFKLGKIDQLIIEYEVSYKSSFASLIATRVRIGNDLRRSCPS